MITPKGDLVKTGARGYLHAEGCPAKITREGALMWLKEGRFHRDDGPAIILPTGERFWCVEGRFKRSVISTPDVSVSYERWITLK